MTFGAADFPKNGIELVRKLPKHFSDRTKNITGDRFLLDLMRSKEKAHSDELINMEVARIIKFMRIAFWKAHFWQALWEKMWHSIYG